MRKFPKRKRKGEFASPLERSVWAKLDHKTTKYEPEVINYTIKHEYTPDFVVTRKDGSKIYLEVKGWLRYEDQRKMRAVKEDNPDLDIRFYFPKDQKVHLSKMLNSEWCKKHGFPCYIGKISKRWFQ